MKITLSMLAVLYAGAVSAQMKAAAPAASGMTVRVAAAPMAPSAPGSLGTAAPSVQMSAFSAAAAPSALAAPLANPAAAPVAAAIGNFNSAGLIKDGADAAPANAAANPQALAGMQANKDVRVLAGGVEKSGVDNAAAALDSMYEGPSRKMTTADVSVAARTRIGSAAALAAQSSRVRMTPFSASAGDPQLEKLADYLGVPMKTAAWDPKTLTYDRIGTLGLESISVDHVSASASGKVTVTYYVKYADYNLYHTPIGSLTGKKQLYRHIDAPPAKETTKVFNFSPSGDDRGFALDPKRPSEFDGAVEEINASLETPAPER